MQTILITGATGLLGSSLVPYLRDAGYSVITHAHKSRCADILGDLSDGSRACEILEKVKPSIIINLASLTSVELCEDQANLAYLTNTCTVENLVRWIESSGLDCHLVQISTDHIYGGIGLHVEDSVSLTNTYAFSKYAGELAARRVPSTILRTNFVGRSKLSDRESLTDWVYNSIIAKRHVQVLSDVYFSPLSIAKLVEMIELVVQKRLIGVYNLGSHNGMSKADFDFSFAEALKLPTNTMTRIEAKQALFLKANRPKDMRMDCSKFENDFDVKLPNLSDLIYQISKEYDEVT